MEVHGVGGTQSEFGALFPRECTKGTSQKLASILGEADDTTDAMRMVTGMRATYGSLTTGMDRGRASNAALPPPAQSKLRRSHATRVSLLWLPWRRVDPFTRVRERVERVLHRHARRMSLSLPWVAVTMILSP